MMTMSKKRLGKGLQALIPSVEDENQGVTEININRILPNPHQPRRDFDDEKLEELAASIREHGVIQPIIVRENGDMYELVAGERRWRAAKKLGHTTIPAIIKEYTDGEVMEIALIENLQREDLNPIEEAAAYKQLMEEFGLTQDELSKKIGKSRSLIANSIRLLNLPAEIQELLEKGAITTGHARSLLSLDDKGMQMELARRIIEEGLTVRDIERIVKKAVVEKDKKTKKAPETKDPLLLDIEERLKMVLGTQVRIKNGRNKGKIEIEYYSGEDLERIIEIFLKNNI